MLIVPVGLAIGALLHWQSLAGKVPNDNAYLKQDMVSVSAEVGGAITGVLVKDGDVVQAGQLLFRIDPEPFRLQINEANAAIASAQANVIALSNASELTGTDMEAASSNVAFAEARFERVRALRQRGFSTKADYEAAELQVVQAREGVRQAQDCQREARTRFASGLPAARPCRASTHRSPPPRRAVPMPSSRCAAPRCSRQPPGVSRRRAVCRLAIRPSPTFPCLRWCARIRPMWRRTSRRPILPT